MKNSADFYLGNSKLKRAGVTQKMSVFEMQEYARCTADIIYFVKTYVKIISLDKGLVNFNLFPYQEKMLLTMFSEKYSMFLTPRQFGKTQVAAAFVLWATIFNKEYTSAILANKGDQAREIMGRLQLMYEELPWFLQPGVKVWNKGSIELGNKSRVFTASTSSSAVRGRSLNCVTGETKVTFCDDYENIFHTQISKLPDIKANSPKNKYKHCPNGDASMYYTVYRIKNKINDKEYIGYHQTDDLDDGYMGSGKLIKRAIEKYGVNNFEKEYIAIFDNRNTAELLEAVLVDEDYTHRKDTYNISQGGNVMIATGKNNPFYGKTHSPETIEKITSKTRGMVTGNGKPVIYDGKYFDSLYKCNQEFPMTFKERNSLFRSGKLRFVDIEEQEKIETYFRYVDARSKYNSIEKSLRAKKLRGIKRTEEFKKKVSDGLKGKSHPWQDKINKNPEKIRKTMEKHIGSTRSESARLNMSLSKKAWIEKNGVPGKGCTYWIEPNSKDIIRVLPGEVPPEGYVRGSGKHTKKAGKKWFNDGNNMKLLNPDSVPDGWVLGRL